MQKGGRDQDRSLAAHLEQGGDGTDGTDDNGTDSTDRLGGSRVGRGRRGSGTTSIDNQTRGGISLGSSPAWFRDAATYAAVVALELAAAPVDLAEVLTTELATEEAEAATDEALWGPERRCMSSGARIRVWRKYLSTYTLEAEATAEETREVAPPTTPPVEETAALEEAEMAEETDEATGMVDKTDWEPVLVAATVEPAEVPEMG